MRRDGYSHSGAPTGGMAGGQPWLSAGRGPGEGLMELQGPRVSQSRACGLGADVQHLQKASQEARGAVRAACAAYRPDLCIRPAEQGKQTLRPAERGASWGKAHTGAALGGSGGAYLEVGAAESATATTRLPETGPSAPPGP